MPFATSRTSDVPASQRSISDTPTPAGSRLVLACGVLALAAGYSIVALYRHWHFESSYDLGIYDQAVWHLSRFETPASTLRNLSTVFGDHFHPIIGLFAPLFWVAPAAETLIVAQALLLALSAVPVFLYARDRLSAGPALGLTAAYGLFWGVQQTALFDVHEAAFAPLVMATLILAMERRRWAWFWTAAVLLTLIKEDLGPVLMCVGAYLLVRGERWRGALLVATSFVSFVVVVALLIPSANDAHVYGYRGTYDAILRRPWLLPEILVTPPIKLLTAFLWVAPFALLPLASPLSLLLVPFALERFTSGSPNHWGTIFHYSAPLAPIVAMAAADGLARIGRRIRSAKTRARTIVLFTGACVVLSAVLPGHQPLWRAFSQKLYRSTALHTTGYAALAVIPADASVAAQTAVAPHLTHRATIHVLDENAPDDEYVIAGRGLSPWPLATEEDVTSLLNARRNHGYAVVFERDGWVVLRRGPLVGDR